MPRIRSIKPEFWTDDKIGLLSFVGRLLFIGLWNLADDTGVLEDSPLQLKAQLFPYDGVSRDDVEAQLAILARLGMVVRYNSQNKKLLWVRHFSNHQSPQHGHYKYKDSPPPGFHFDRNRFVPSLTDKSVSPVHSISEPSVSVPIMLTDPSALEEERGGEQEEEKETSPTPEGVGAPARESNATAAEIGETNSTLASEGSSLPGKEGPDGPGEPSRSGPGGVKEVLDELERLWGHKLVYRPKEKAAIREALASHYTVAQIVQCWRAAQQSPRWRGRWIPLAMLVEDLREFVKNDRGPLVWQQAPSGEVADRHPDEVDRKEYLRRYGHLAGLPAEPAVEEGAT